MLEKNMEELIISFEGKTQDLNDFVFDLFEAHMLAAGLEKETPGDAKLVLKPMLVRKSALSQAVIEVGLFVGQNVVLPLFVTWLYDKWKKNGEKHVSIKIENHLYQFDPDLLGKAIEEALAKRDSRKTSPKALKATAKDFPVKPKQPAGRKTRP
jgi:hypothetical protein